MDKKHKNTPQKVISPEQKNVVRKEKNIDYEECRDIEVMQGKGFTEAPMLEVDGVCLKFVDAMKWVLSI